MGYKNRKLQVFCNCKYCHSLPHSHRNLRFGVSLGVAHRHNRDHGRMYPNEFFCYDLKERQGPCARHYSRDSYPGHASSVYTPSVSQGVNGGTEDDSNGPSTSGRGSSSDDWTTPPSSSSSNYSYGSFTSEGTESSGVSSCSYGQFTSENGGSSSPEEDSSYGSFTSEEHTDDSDVSQGVCGLMLASSQTKACVSSHPIHTLQDLNAVQLQRHLRTEYPGILLINVWVRRA